MVNNDQLHLIHELREQGVDWESISEVIEGFTDNDRKLYYGYKLGLETSEDASLIKQAKTLQKIRLSRKELGIERSINNEQVRAIALHKTFTNQVVEAIQNRYTGFNIDFKSNKSFLNTLDTTNAHIFTMSDFHYDGDLDCLKVINTATGQILSVIEEKKLDHIYLVELGDTIDGASLRTSQLMAIKKGMVAQVMDVADAYIKMLRELSNVVTVTFISVDSSNHTQIRNLGTKQNQLVEEDLMVIFNKMIELALPDLNFIHEKEVLVEIGGFMCYFAHGHLVKNKDKYIENLQADMGVEIDFGFFGNFHHQRSIDLHSSYLGTYDKRAFFVPALSKEYSQYEKDKNLSSVAGVGYYVLQNEYGQIEERKLKV